MQVLIYGLTLSALLSGCTQSGQPSPGPTKTVYVPVPSQNNGGLGSYDNGEIQGQLDAAKQTACDSAQEIMWQWIQLNTQLAQMDMNGFGQSSGSLNLDSDFQMSQLRNQIFQLQQQEQKLRQICNG